MPQKIAKLLTLREKSDLGYFVLLKHPSLCALYKALSFKVLGESDVTMMIKWSQ